MGEAARPAVPALLAFLGLLLTGWTIARLTKDRVCVGLAVGAYLMKVLLTSGLYYASFYGWPLLRSYQGERGFWVFAEDALAYHYHGIYLLRAWNGLAPLDPPDFSNWSFIVYTGLLYRAFGVHPLNVAFLNAWCGTVIVGAGLIMMQRMGFSVRAIRVGVALLGFWPSLLLWSSQPMKDPLLLALIMLGLALTVMLTDVQHQRPRVLVSLVGLQSLLLLVTSLFRQYIGVALGIVSMFSAASVMIRSRTRMTPGMLRWCVVLLLSIPLVIVMAGQLDLGGLVGRSVRQLEAPTARIRTSASAAPPSTASESGPESTPANTLLPEGAPPPSLNISRPPRMGKRRFSRVMAQLNGLIGDMTIKALGVRRQGFISTGGYSLIDPVAQLRGPFDVLRYLPRALSISLLAPFPWQWFDVYGSTRGFRLFTSVEATLVYLLLAGFLMRIGSVRQLFGIQTAAVFLFILINAIPMCLTVANLGTLFRLRLQFLLPLILLVSGVDIIGAYRGSLQWIWARFLVTGRAMHRLGSRLVGRSPMLMGSEEAR